MLQALGQAEASTTASSPWMGRTVPSSNNFISPAFGFPISSMGRGFATRLAYLSKTVTFAVSTTPSLAGAFSDLVIFRRDLSRSPVYTERVVGENGYRNYRCVFCGELECHVDIIVHSSIRALHGNVNELLQNFNVVKQRFQHRLSLIFFCFHAVAPRKT